MRFPYDTFKEAQTVKDTPNFHDGERVVPTQIADLNSAVVIRGRALTRESEPVIQTETYSEGNNPNISILTNPKMGEVLPTT
mmetsp:Transcript_4163/g.6193  ORF Transcript_4163/g.6193 Transcript_4163/m.6193 type:complete len:82 (+) Transcript_4163:2671-2916(+)